MINQPLPNVAVFLAAYNGVRWSAEQLDSILNQVDACVTVFVSVDLSTDGTEEWFDQRAATDHRIVLLPHGVKFGGAARNFFRLLNEVDLSSFDYLSFADQDDIWLPAKLSRAHEELLSSGAAAYSSNVTAFWSDGGKAPINKSQPQTRWDFLFEAAGPGCTYVIQIELACAIQDLVKSRWAEVQEICYHDWFVYAFARAKGYKWVIDSVPSMLYRQHESNQVGANAGWHAFLHRVGKVLSGSGLAQSALTARLVGLGDAPFVMRWECGSRSGLVYLALHAAQCRRRVRDKFIFALSCVALIVTRRKCQ